MAKKTFETALSKLEQITDELEAGELPLDKSLKKFSEGIELVNYCNQHLEEAKGKIELLLHNTNQDDDTLRTAPFTLATHEPETGFGGNREDN